jgi:hypothetical protein
MPKKRHTPEEIVAKLLTSQGRSLGEAIRSIGVVEATYYRAAARRLGRSVRLSECQSAARALQSASRDQRSVGCRCWQTTTRS